jgi:hypothetical protein
MTLAIYVNAKLRKVLYSPTTLYLIRLAVDDVVDVVVAETREEREIVVGMNGYYKFGLSKDGKIVAERV